MFSSQNTIHSAVKYVLALSLLGAMGAGCMPNSPPTPVVPPNVQPTSQAPGTPEAARPNAEKPNMGQPQAAQPPSLQPNAPKTSKPGPATVIVSMVDNAFQPKELSINAGDTVVWKNNGKAPHTVTGVDAGLLWDSGNIAPGKTYQRTFTSAGSYNYRCNIHPDMLGKVFVYE